MEKLGKRKKKWIAAVAVVLCVAVAATAGYQAIAVTKENEAVTYETAKVTRKTIQTVLSGTGTITPKNQYNVTSMVKGEVLTADFKEGDTVKKGQALYTIDTSDATKNLEQSELALEKAQRTYDKAVESKSKLVITAQESGIVKKVYVKKGDNIQAGANIADVYDNSSMLIEIPFPAASVTSAWVGKRATVQMDIGSETVKGTVTKVSSIEDVKSGNVLTKNVTIKVTNPGGITDTTTATAQIGEVAASGSGTFTPLIQATLTANQSGEIHTFTLEEGDKVTKGTTIITLSSDSIDEQIESSEYSIEDAELTLKNQQEALDDYTIKAPISGEIITKTTKKGDTLDNTNGSTVMAVIYDLSQLTFQMNIDELDILTVEKGQEVTVTADALEGTELGGKVTNVSISGTTTNGVTAYPVTVTMEDAGDLLPGMNVTGQIVTEEAEDALVVPVSAVMRGDLVYVQENSGQETEKGDGSTAEEKTAKENAAEDSSTKENVAGTTKNGEADSGRTKGNAVDTGTSNSQKEGIAAGTVPEGTTPERTSPEEPAPTDSDTKTSDTTAASDSDTKTSDTTASKDAKENTANKNSNIPEGFTAVEVKIGLNDDNYIEIKSGLKEGDIVYIPVAKTTTVKESGSSNSGGMSGGSTMPGGGGMSGGGMSGGGMSGGGMPTKRE